MNPPPIIFVAGMPRSGSMWTYNVCRALITASGKTPWPGKVPLDETPAINHALSTPPAPGQIYCIKTHFNIPVDKPHTRIVCNFRDVRDAMLSYMRFMKCEFDRALGVAKGCMELTDHYLRESHANVLPVRYDEMVSRPFDVIRQLGKYLDLQVSDNTYREIESQYLRETLKEKLAGIESDQSDEGNPLQVGGKERYTVAPNLDGSFRVFDKDTGFQSNHISSTDDGAWRTVFNSDQKERIMRLAESWLIRYGFKL